jgi:uncharacterized membrane protein
MVSQSPSAIVAVYRPQPFFVIFLPFPVSCFTLALFTDIAYWRTGTLLWQNFSSWLLFAGLIFAGIAAIAMIVDFFVGRLIAPLTWPVVIGGVIAFVLALLNSLFHAGDGWTAVVPYGPILSALTIIVMVVANWFVRAVRVRIYGGRDVELA